jgi:hypothetical protein
VVSDLLVRARHGRSGRVPPDGPRPGHPGALGHHHPGVLPPGPGPGHGTALAHMLREDAAAADQPDGRSGIRIRTIRTGTSRTKSRTSSPGPGSRSGPVRLRGPVTPRSRRVRRHRPVPPRASFPVPRTRGARHP